MRRRQAVDSIVNDGLPKQAGRDHAWGGLPAKKTLKVATVPGRAGPLTVERL
jgi:hypothetical protein